MAWRACRILLVLGLIAMGSVAALAGDYKITTLVDSNENRPDGIRWVVAFTPALDGNYVIFLTLGLQGPPDALWSIDTRTMTPKKIVDTSTRVPHGTGDFTGFVLFFNDENPSPTVGGGYAAFYGTDANGVHGLYTIPEKGGLINRIVTTATLAPDTLTPFTNFAEARTNGTKIAFYGATSTTAGIYEADIDGKHLKAVIDSNRHLNARGYGGGKGYYSGYSMPVIGQSQVAFYATGVGDPSTYPNEIFTTAAPGYSGVADNLTPLGGDPAGLGHTEISAFSAAAENSDLAFYAWDGEYFGIFEPSGGIGRTAARLVSSTQKVPGAKDKFSSCNASGSQDSCFGPFSFDSSGLAFVATDATYAQSVFFEPPGAAPVLIAPGTTFSSFGFPTLGDRSVSGGRFTFYARDDLR
jgi:hypothetical protein